MKRFALVCLAAAGCLALSQQQAPAVFKLNVGAGANVCIMWGPPYFHNHPWGGHFGALEPQWASEPFPYWGGAAPVGSHGPAVVPDYPAYAPSPAEPPLAAPANPKPLPNPAPVQNTAYWNTDTQPVNYYNYTPYNYAPYGYGYYGYGYSAPSYWYGN